MIALKQILVFACVIVSVAMISGCTMSDSDIQNYIDSHPDEVKAYVDSHGEQISSYLAEHPEILEQITLPETQAPLEQLPMAMEELETTKEPIETPTTAIPEATPTVAETTVIQTTVATTIPTPTPTTTIPTTEPTPTIIVTPTENVTTVATTIIPTTTPATVSTPTPEPTPTGYLDETGRYALVSYERKDWHLETTEPNTPIFLTYMNCIPSDLTGMVGTCSMSGTISTSGSGVNDPVSGPSVGYSFSFTWTDIGNGDYRTSEIPNLDQVLVLSPDNVVRSERTMHYDQQTRRVTISGYNDITFWR